MIAELLERLLPEPAAGRKPLDRRRSPQWPAVRKAHLAKFPSCAACGEKKMSALAVHHVQVFHLCPQRELDPANLLTLCEGRGGGCHLLIGHLNLWRSYNACVIADAAWLLKKIKGRP